MLFVESQFLFGFLPITFLLFCLALKLTGIRGALLTLIAASLYFYGAWRLWALWVIGASIVVNFVAVRIILVIDNRNRSWWVAAAAIVFDLGLLAVFKYSYFVLDNVPFGENILTSGSIILPIGLSFYTFQQVALVVDAQRGLVGKPAFLPYALFVSFFPQLIAGPIVQYRDVAWQFANHLRLDWSNVWWGSQIFLFGLAKKVVLADNLAWYVDGPFAQAANRPPEFLTAWLGALAYTFQIYFDFSGYSDMAIGLALIFSIKLPINFASPYQGVSITQFWRRWHITLSSFLRDYLYIPFGGNRRGRLRRYLHLTLTMLLGGLWHGAGWTFILWGGLHGLYLVAHQAWSTLGKPLPTTVSAAITFFAVVIAWVFFRASDLNSAMNMLRGMTGGSEFALPGAFRGILTGEAFLSWFGNTAMQAHEFIVGFGYVVIAAAIALLANNTQTICGYRVAEQSGTGPTAAAEHRPRFLASAFYAGVLVWLVGFSVFGSAPSQFIYFQF